MEIAYENRIWKSHMEIAYVGASFANFDSADLVEILYGNRICRRKFRNFRFGGSCGNRIWKSHMEIAYGNRIWKSHMSAQVSQISIRRILLKSYMEIAYGNLIWKSDLAEIAYGNRICKSHMEIAYVG